MGFRKRNANKSDNCSKSKVVMGKPASQLTKEDKKILSARMAESRVLMAVRLRCRTPFPICVCIRTVFARYRRTSSL